MRILYSVLDLYAGFRFIYIRDFAIYSGKILLILMNVLCQACLTALKALAEIGLDTVTSANASKTT